MRLRKIPIFLAVAGVLLVACGAFDPAAAVVDGRKIDDDRFERMVSFILADPRAVDDQLGEEEIEQNRREIVRQLLTFLIQQEVVQERADRSGIEVPKGELDGFLENTVQQIGGEEAFREQLESSGAMVADVRFLLEAQILRDRVSGDVVLDELSEEELRRDFEERSLEFTEVRVAHILVPTREEAEDLLRRANPDNFGSLARRFSQDPGSAPQGGDLGRTAATDFVEPFARAATEIPVGEIGGPVETDFGFHVLHVIDRETPPFEAVRDRLIDERSGQVFLEWLRGRVRSADVRVNPRYGAFDSRSGQVVERRATTPQPGPQVTP